MAELVYVELMDVSYLDLVPTGAERVHGQCYRLLDTSPDPEHFRLQFQAPEVVHCIQHQFAEGEFGWRAVSRCSCAGG